MSIQSEFRAWVLITSLSLALPAFSGYERIIQTEPVPLARLRGVVVDPVGEVLPGVEVEIYRNPEALLDNNRLVESEKTPIKSTVTGPGGEFDIPKVSAGNYELRFTKPGFNQLSVILSLAPKSKKASKKPMQIRMSLAT